MAEAAFPPALTDLRAFHIAKAMLEGFDRHYSLFRETSAAAKQRFERADWHDQQTSQALHGLVHALVVELDALRLRLLLAVPVGVFEATLGFAAGLAEQAVVAVEALAHGDRKSVV